MVRWRVGVVWNGTPVRGTRVVMRIAVAVGCDEVTAADGTELRFYEVGAGPTSVVLLHGLFGSPSNWISIMEELAESYRFFALQLPIDYQTERNTRPSSRSVS